MIEWKTIQSQAISNFPMGDSGEREFPVYVPPGYNHKRPEPYPVIYWLSGWGGRGAKYLGDHSVFTKPLEVRLDRAILRGELSECLIVFVDGASKLGCSQYINSPAIGNYSDYICEDLVTFIDNTFNTHRSADFRAIAGHSSGGFGALVNGIMRPDCFKFVCSSSGDSFFEANLPRNIIFAIETLEQAGGVNKFLELFLNHPDPDTLGQKASETMLTLSMAPCYAPNLKNSPLLGDLFFDEKTGAIKQKTWDKYLAWDPVRMLDRFKSHASQLRFVLLEAGISDEHGLQLGHRQIAVKLAKLGVPFENKEYPGTHSSLHYRIEHRFTILVKKIMESQK